MANAIRFEWDPRKAGANRRKHGIDFEFATLAFYDPLKRIEVEGDDHGEIRWRIIGEIEGRIFVICYTTGEKGEVEIVRIISARKAGRRERQEYEETS
jgi:uncharacterized DUF497 family protein